MGEGVLMTIKKTDSKPEKKKCVTCEKFKDPTKDYYISFSRMHTDKRVPVCKLCLSVMFNPNNIQDSLKDILRQIDKPYLYHIVDASIKENPDNVFGKYMKNIGMRQHQGLTWDNSLFESNSHEHSASTQHNSHSNNPYPNEEDTVDKWGFGYTQDEYRQFERKYNMLKNNYQEKTAMHTEALLTYIRYRVKEELATAQGDSKAAKEWGTLAKDAATAAKINPSQLSKSDLSDGLDTFGQLVRTVEQAVDIIPILPKFKEKPQDRADFTIWCYVNYVRDLKGLPPADYKEIYEFYEVRRKAYEDAANIGDEDDIT